MRPSIAFGVGTVLLVIALGLAAAIEAPATLFDERLDAFSGGRVRIGSAQGTVWRGSGELTLLSSSDEQRVPISWHVRALPMFWGELAGTLVNAGSGSAPGSASGLTSVPTDFSLSHKRATLHNFTFALPAGALLRIGELPPLIVASGRLELAIDSMTIDERTIDGRAIARWQGAALAVPGGGAAILFGDVRLDLVGQRDQLVGTMSNAGGEVDVKGTAAVGMDGSPRVDLALRIRPTLDKERAAKVAATLGLFSGPDGAGVYHIVWRA